MKIVLKSCALGLIVLPIALGVRDHERGRREAIAFQWAERLAPQRAR